MDEEYYPNCPICQRVIPLKRGDDLNQIIDDHMEKNCRVVRSATFTPCSFLNCTNKSYVPMYCDDCQNVYCVQHRHKADHQCKPTIKDVAESSIQTQSREVITAEEGKERIKIKKELPPGVTEGVLSEEDAMSIAIEASIKCLAEEEIRRRKEQKEDDKCIIS